MAHIAFILLCHKDPDAIIDQARRLTAGGDCVAIHFDARAANADYARIKQALDDEERVVFVRDRLKCGWGEWSLVEATLKALDAALTAFPDASHFYMLSGDCMPIKSAGYAHDYLDAHNRDYIESFDFFDSDWIKTGLRDERLIYRHVFNERSHKWLFYRTLALQKRLGVKRRIPEDLQIMIGSQWWCLRRQTVSAILAFCDARRDVLRFFRSTWIPDETFFQTLVRHLVPEAEIASRTLTFLMFSDYGMPVTFYNDHYEMLLAQDYLFARKISPEANRLKEQLGALYATTGQKFQISNEGRAVFHYLTQRGREGRRFAPRFWEADSKFGRDHKLHFLVCKKWHIAKRLVTRIRDHTEVPGHEYVFNEQSCPLPDLGGLQTCVTKRHRHRHALIRLLFEYHQTRSLIVCLDPSDIDLLGTFTQGRMETHVLEVDCQFSDTYLTGHAKRVGLASETTSSHTLERLLPTIRQDIVHESARLRDAQLPNHSLMRETDPCAQKVEAIAQFLAIDEKTAQTIVGDDTLFAD